MCPNPDADSMDTAEAMHELCDTEYQLWLSRCRRPQAGAMCKLSQEDVNHFLMGLCPAALHGRVDNMGGCLASTH